MHTLFACAGRNARESWRSWPSMSAREFYDGDIEGDLEDAEFRFDKALAYPISITHLTSEAQIGYRRNWQHIRGNKVGLRVIWIVRQGGLKIARSGGSSTINVGEGGIIDSNAPFHAKLICKNDKHESFQIIVPAHLFLTHLAHAEKFAGSFSLGSSEGAIAEHLLSIFVASGDTMRRNTARLLAESFLEVLGDCIEGRDGPLPHRQRLVDKRLTDIENYILMNLTDSELCYDKVAASCGISPRYLCYILKANNTSFSDLLWKNRLPKARDWLVAPANRDYPIHEIAFMAGFKSAAHFSRMFKAAYGCTPREYRATGGVDIDRIDDLTGSSPSQFANQAAA